MDKYEEIRTLGAGQFGQAVLVRNKLTDQQYVNKQIQISNIQDEKRKYAFNETVIFSLFNHKHITQYVETINQNDEILNIIMEYADMGDLSDYIEEHKNEAPFAEYFIVKYFNQICDAIYHIHTRKIIHRDIKLENIFLKSTNQNNGEFDIKLGDFGVSKILDKESVTYTMVGSLFYQAPEITKGPNGYSYKSDVFSLGCVLYELCAFKSLEKNYRRRQSIYKRMENNALKELDSNVYSQKLRQLISKMLEVDPANRFDMLQVLDYMAVNYQQKNISISINMSQITVQSKQQIEQQQQSTKSEQKVEQQPQQPQLANTNVTPVEPSHSKSQDQLSLSGSQNIPPTSPEYLKQLQQYQQNFIKYSVTKGGKQQINAVNQQILEQNRKIMEMMNKQKEMQEVLMKSKKKQASQPNVQLPAHLPQAQIANQRMQEDLPVNLYQHFGQLDVFTNKNIVQSIQQQYIEQYGSQNFKQLSNQLLQHQAINPQLLGQQNRQENNDLMLIIMKGLTDSKSLSLL